MAEAGINTVRTYTVPGEALLDEAARHGLKVMVGIPWTQHVAFLDDARPASARFAATRPRRCARSRRTRPRCSSRVGNEIPPAVVRWHGQRRIERFLRELYDEVKSGAPESLLTYVNFPPTEYLDIDAFDVCAFNVYLHREPDLRAYLARLQHIAGERPLLLAEAGADSIREGGTARRAITASHIRTAFAEGACGAIAFSWTDEWWRGGHTVHDWAFGLVDAERQPKPALAAVREAFADAPFAPEVPRHVAQGVGGRLRLQRRRHDRRLPGVARRADLSAIRGHRRQRRLARRHRRPGAPLPRRPRHRHPERRPERGAQPRPGRSHRRDRRLHRRRRARRSRLADLPGAAAAVAGVRRLRRSERRAARRSVRRAVRGPRPGGPTQVLLDDRVAEHVPGCNMAFRRDALAGIGGFNPVYLRAGDDVDVCWRLQAKGFKIGFAPSALVWHHHRSSVKAYWRQQVGYGEGETWLDAHHPEKFIGGQMLWRGRIYSPLPFVRSLSGRRINTGVWGTAAFPGVYRTDVNPLQFVPHSASWMAASTLLCLAGVPAAFVVAYPIEALLLLGAGLRRAGARRSRAAGSSPRAPIWPGFRARRRGAGGCATAR